MNSGRIQLQEYMGFGGKSFDSVHLSRFYNPDRPHDFGVKVARMFSSSNRFSYKPLTALTIGAGNYFESDNDLYRWSLNVDDYRPSTVSEFLETGNSRIGYNGETFRIGLSEPWYSSPDVICGENNNFPIEVIGTPIQKGSYWEYTCRLQESNPNVWIDAQWLQKGRTFCKVSTRIGIEMNQEHGGVSMGTQIDLQSQFGAFGDKFEVTDRVIREELNRKAAGQGTMQNSPYTAGYRFGIYDPKTSKQVPGGGFIPFMEAKLLDQIEMDREWAMYFGKVSTRRDSTGRYITRTSPGYKQLVKDGWEMVYSNGIDAATLEDYFMTIFMGRVDEANRKVVLSTGTLGERIFDQLLSDEMGAFLTPDTSNDYFVRNKGEAGDLEVGHQFKSYKGKNGLRISLVNNPMLDDPKYCGQRYPFNSIYTLDSARMDIYDLSPQGASEAPDKSNMSMIKLKNFDLYHWYGGCVDPKTGVVNNGSMTASGEKGVVCRRETSGGLIVFDTSRIGSIYMQA